MDSSYSISADLEQLSIVHTNDPDEKENDNKRCHLLNIYQGPGISLSPFYIHYVIYFSQQFYLVRTIIILPRFWLKKLRSQPVVSHEAEVLNQVYLQSTEQKSCIPSHAIATGHGCVYF